MRREERDWMIVYDECDARHRPNTVRRLLKWHTEGDSLLAETARLTAGDVVARAPQQQNTVVPGGTCVLVRIHPLPTLPGLRFQHLLENRRLIFGMSIAVDVPATVERNFVKRHDVCVICRQVRGDVIEGVFTFIMGGTLFTVHSSRPL